ncbi:MAG TPA: hypothetical protein VFI11_11720 [Anaerolineales bacterium]|nr:hypothetical protein [Anaerolineales bacterium]
MAKRIKINRAPVLTLWASIVAERLGFDPEAALTLGRAVAGLTAQSKGRHLGIYTAGEKKEEGAREKEAEADADLVYVNLMGRAIPSVRTRRALRAADKGKPADPDGVRRYLQSKFGESLKDAEAAMRDLAAAFPPDELEEAAYPLYQRFRPEIPKGTKGWGAEGELDLDQVRALKPK